jgi:hypothetical protein
MTICTSKRFLKIIIAAAEIKSSARGIEDNSPIDADINAMTIMIGKLYLEEPSNIVLYLHPLVPNNSKLA